MTFWERLGIAPTEEISRIRSAYAARSRETHPEDAPEAFSLLHEAYLAALAYARSRTELQIPEVPETGFHSVRVGRGPTPAPGGAGMLVFPGEAAVPPQALLPPAGQETLHCAPPAAAASAPEAVAAPEMGGGLVFPGGTVIPPQAVSPAGSDPLHFAQPAAASLPEAFAGAVCMDAGGGSPLDFTALLQAVARNAALAQPGVRPEEEALRERRRALLDSWLRIAGDIGRREACATWREALNSPEFRELKADPAFIVQLSGFCRDHAELPLAFLAELYTEYELYAESASRTAFCRLLRNRLGLPVRKSESMRMRASELRACIRRVLDGMARLNASSGRVLDASGWLLAVQSSRFRTVCREPAMVLELTAFLENAHTGQSLLTALARWYGMDRKEAVGVFAPLYRLLEPFQVQAAGLAVPPEGAAGQDFLDPEAEEQLWNRLVDRQMHRLETTADEFRYSPRREPWDTVLRSPECLAVLDSPVFLNRLASFLERKDLPAGLLPALRDACAQARLRSVYWPETFCRRLGEQKPAGLNRLEIWKRPAWVLSAAVCSLALLGLLFSLLSPYVVAVCVIAVLILVLL